MDTPIRSIPWGQELISNQELVDAGVALEALGLESLTQGSQDPLVASYFKPINIVVEKGLFYVHIYACQCWDGSDAIQELAMWLGSLKKTDTIKLTVSTLYPNIPLDALIALMGSLSATPAKIHIRLDTLVMDAMAYFYLLADKILVESEGALFIPSYVTQRNDDHSLPWKAIHDFYQWLTEDAVLRQRLSEDDAAKLNSGQHIVLDVTQLTF